ncbi:hypothetical protein OG462_41935 [Streptomyces sp. NBC_01077]|uniref:hypothetical protein n=1 Tax=Streptomyces sp. NBC_01077 TaxID=2903746 RepID=UPI0038696C78|nr:hypothetical protein OG462_03085 [Streptomyces sp. NBC_01077]WSV43438.1 hypothetical protein OG462_41935 [Streptomyces sp. NBC_01077]
MTTIRTAVKGITSTTALPFRRLEARGIGWRQIAAQILLVLIVGALVPLLLLSNAS